MSDFLLGKVDRTARSGSGDLVESQDILLGVPVILSTCCSLILHGDPVSPAAPRGPAEPASGPPGHVSVVMVTELRWFGLLES